MNNARRKEIRKILNELVNLKILSEELNERLEQLKDEEEESFNNMPEGLQTSERGIISEEAISQLDSVLDYMADCNDNINECRDLLDEIISR